MRHVSAAVFALLVPVASFAQNCAGTSVGRTPLVDLGAGLYQGFEGGLYPGGANVPPPAHAAAGLAAAAAVTPRLPDGTAAPSAPNARIVLCSLGMSNATQEFSTFLPTSGADVLRNPRVSVVDAAQGGVSAAPMSDPTNPYWTTFVPGRLAAAGVTAAQVQVVWIKNAEAGPTAPFPASAATLRDHLRAIVQNAKARFPNLRLAYLSSRSYAGYATSALNPEPFAYESGFSVKWLIEEQIAGDAALNFDPNVGPVVAPWIGWGPYLWADGVNPRSDGLTYACADFGPDGTHPGVLGRFKIAALLDQFFRTAPTSTPWYVASTPHAVPAGLFFYGEGTPGSNGLLQVVATGGPEIGTVFNGLGVNGAPPNAAGAVFLSFGYADLPASGGRIHVDLAGLFAPSTDLPSTFVTNGAGFGGFVVGIPNVPALMGLSIYAQIAVLDSGAAAFPELGGISATRGMRLIFGAPAP